MLEDNFNSQDHIILLQGLPLFLIEIWNLLKLLFQWLWTRFNWRICNTIQLRLYEHIFKSSFFETWYRSRLSVLTKSRHFQGLLSSVFSGNVPLLLLQWLWPHQRLKIHIIFQPVFFRPFTTTRSLFFNRWHLGHFIIGGTFWPMEDSIPKLFSFLNFSMPFCHLWCHLKKHLSFRA